MTAKPVIGPERVNLHPVVVCVYRWCSSTTRAATLAKRVKILQNTTTKAVNYGCDCSQLRT